MRECSTLNIYYFLSGLIFVGCATGAGMSARSIVESVLNVERDRPPVMMDINVFQKYAHGDKYGKRFSVQLRQKGEMFDIISISFLVKDDMSLEKLNDSRLIWNGKRSFWRRETLGHKVRGFVTNEKKSMPWRTHAPYLHGILDYGLRHYTELLLESSDLKIRPEQEVISRFPCYVVEGDTGNGHYTVWIDAENGFRYRKAIMHKVFNPPLQVDSGQMLISETSEISDVKVDLIKGVPVITKASKIVHNSYADGTTTKDILEAKISNIQWNPHFQSVGAFTMDLPNGTIVHDMNFGITYTWQNGKLIADIDKYVIEQIDKITEELAVEGGVPAGLANAKKTKAAPNEPPPVADTQPETQVDITEAQREVLSESDSFSMIPYVLFGLIIAAVIIWLASRRFKA